MDLTTICQYDNTKVEIKNPTFQRKLRYVQCGSELVLIVRIKITGNCGHCNNIVYTQRKHCIPRVQKQS
ncbi:Hypothetical protein PACV_257 [Pacmanvirus A23]|uniref:Hypothetical protein n=1 Tax=Pacmanvirus A23 TaxID=1932881 RepID=UPI000A092F6E|nr:Hypothetical protein B9W72_gp255 [Pacmanvirus A23]SIP85972.1 Hypothetical protein PACV_257 [Pacmanvirus A23]